MFAVGLAGAKGDVTNTHVLWTKEGYPADVPTPSAAGGRVYVCSDKGELSCLDIKTGNLIWSERLEKHRDKFSASPVLVDGKIAVTREDGTTFFVRQGDRYELLGKATVNEYTLATPVFTDGQVLIRSVEHLFCIRN